MRPGHVSLVKKGNGRGFGRGHGRPRVEDALERLETLGNDAAPAPSMSRADSIKKAQDCAKESKSNRRISNLIGVLHDVQMEAEALLPASAVEPSEQNIKSRWKCFGMHTGSHAQCC